MKKSFVALAAATALATLAMPAAAQEATQATAYINPDTGKPTANEDVESGSSCESPDSTDTQAAGGDPATENVHVDGCLRNTSGTAVDEQATYEVSGNGYIHACPDPDAEGPKTATATDTDGDGENDRCTLSGYEADNEEYHVRVFARTAGEMTVTLCSDPSGNGCADAFATSTVSVTWTGDGAVEELPNTGADARLTSLGLAAMAGAGILALRRRSYAS